MLFRSDFLVFTKNAHENGIEVRVQDHDVWLTQKTIGQIFDVDRSVAAEHLKNVYENGELWKLQPVKSLRKLWVTGKSQ